MEVYACSCTDRVLYDSYFMASFIFELGTAVDLKSSVCRLLDAVLLRLRQKFLSIVVNEKNNTTCQIIGFISPLKKNENVRSFV